MAEFLSVEVIGNNELLDHIKDALKRLDRPKDLMRSLGARLEANIQERFDTKRDPDGQTWAPLSHVTKEIYASPWFIKQNPEFKGGIPGTLLDRTRRMRQSLNSSNAGDDFVEVGMSRLTNGGKWSIPLLHETGTERMPRRGIFFSDPDAGTLGAQDEEALNEELVAFLDDIFLA